MSGFKCHLTPDTFPGPVAQRLAQETHNPLVAGSNPAGPTGVAVNTTVAKILLLLMGAAPVKIFCQGGQKPEAGFVNLDDAKKQRN